MTKSSDRQLKEVLAITKALADQHRLRMLRALLEGELCVCQLTELFGLAASTTSKHLSILAGAGLVRSRKSGRWMYYAPLGEKGSPAAQEVVDWVRRQLAAGPLLGADRRRLRQLLRMDPAELCRRQCKR